MLRILGSARKLCDGLTRREMVTAGGLVFIGGGDGYLYAFDKKTGNEIWRGKIPYENTAVPMTYRTRAGRQFVVVATGAGAGNALVGFALSTR